MDYRRLSEGTRIGRYEIKGKLGSGGFAITYHGWDEILKRPVVIKEYFPHEYAKRDSNSANISIKSEKTQETFSWGLNSFLEEGRTLAKFSHPNIVRVIEFIETNNTAYLIMDFVEGIALTQFLKTKGRIDNETLTSVFYKLLDALVVIHDYSYLHRDIKPDNVIITADEKPILIDFGASRLALEHKKLNLTRVLTPGFGPIEQTHNPENQGPWTDLYALGGTMYYCITGGKNPVTAEERIVNHSRGNPDMLENICETAADHYDTFFLRVIMWMLEIEPANRPQSVEAVLNYLNNTNNTDEHTPTVKIADTKTEPDDDKTSHQPKSKSTFIISATVGLLFLLGGIFWFFQDNQPSPTTPLETTTSVSEAESSKAIAVTDKDKIENDVVDQKIDPPTTANVKTDTTAISDDPGEQAKESEQISTEIENIENPDPGSEAAITLENTEQSQGVIDAVNETPVVDSQEDIAPESVVQTEVPIEAVTEAVTENINADDKTEVVQEQENKTEDTTDQITESTDSDIQKKEPVFKDWPLYSIFKDEFLDAEFEGPELVVIAPGEFRMGDTLGSGGNNELPVHTVTISNKFALSRYEITFSNYDQFAKSTDTDPPNDNGFGRGNNPVINVSWHDASNYAAWLSEQTGFEYRLPSESEWEYAARAGTLSKYWWGDKPSEPMANYSGTGTRDKWEQISPVGVFPVNFYSIYDILGNVAEWVMDCYVDSYRNAPSDGEITNTSNCESHVVRGGSWSDDASKKSVSSRSAYPSDTRNTFMGFRVVREL